MSWSSPDSRVLHYDLLRSTEPGIHSGTVPFTVVGTTTDTSFEDENSLQWGTGYYYALTALKPDSTLLFSDEATITTPLSPFPIPSLLSSTDLYMGRCLLQWTACPDQGFASYTLLRFMYESSMYGDTLGVFDNAQDTTYLDSLPTDYRPRYYKVVTTDSRGLSSTSNLLAHDPEGPLPWLMDRVVNLPWYCMNLAHFTGTPDGRTLFFDYYYEDPWTSFGTLCSYDAEGDVLVDRVFTNSALSAIAFAPEQDALLLARNNPRVIELRSPYTLDLFQSLNVDFTPQGLFALPSGNRGLVSRSNSTYVLDLATLTIVDTRYYSFTGATHIPGYGCYIWGSGGLRRIDPVTLYAVAEHPVSIHGLPVVSFTDDLCCIGMDGVFYRLDPWSLSIRSSSPTPIASPYAAAIYESGGDIYAYLRVEMDSKVHAYRTSDMTRMGSAVYYDSYNGASVWSMLPFPGRNAVWCVYTLPGSSNQGLLRLSP